MKKKKTVVYMVFAAVFAYLFAQVVYFNQAYSPLQVLADARSEAKRLLRFITLYHFQCNATLQMTNSSYWPLCTEKEGGINLESKSKKIAYSIGPKGDLEFERYLSRNLSFQMYLFGMDLNPAEYSNNSHSFKMSIVPNDPADFVRNSYDTQTVNNVMMTLGHSQLDILKMDWFDDSSHAHEILYFLVKDKLLSRVNQLHIALHIDKVDDDYLYNWYRAMYNLFHDARFRLYHTSASDQLCLQVTLMESCVYYMSWIHDPGPRAFILYPPAKDGSQDNEISRLVDYLSEEETTCPEALDISINFHQPLTICQYDGYLHKPCNVIIVRGKSSRISVSGLSHGQCHAVVLQMTGTSHYSTVMEAFVDVKGLLLQPSMRFNSLMEALDHHLHSRSSNILYLDIPDLFWEFLTPLLDSGHLQSVHQLTVDLNLWNDTRSRLPFVIRRRYSELKRVAAYGFQIFKSKNLRDSTLHFKSNLNEQHECCHRLTYVRTRHVSLT